VLEPIHLRKSRMPSALLIVLAPSVVVSASIVLRAFRSRWDRVAAPGDHA
jgi:hypothetical protein